LRIEDLGFKVYGLGVWFGVQVLGFMVVGLEVGVEG
jgi:hypothetical protein